MARRDDSDKRQMSGAEWLQVVSDWPNAKLRAEERWSRLDPASLDDIEGRRERLIERLRDAYGVTEEEASRQVDDFVATHWGRLSAGNVDPEGARTGGMMRGDAIGAGSLSNAETGPRGANTSGGRGGGNAARGHRPLGGKAGER